MQTACVARTTGIFVNYQWLIVNYYYLCVINK